MDIELLSLLALGGVVAGLLAGLFGLGGGAILVPLFLWIFPQVGIHPHDAMMLAVGTSLAIITPTALSSGWSHWRQGNVRGDILKRWFPFVLLGVGLGYGVAQFMGGAALKILFGIFLGLLGIKLLIWTQNASWRSQLPSLPWQALMASSTAGVSVMLGIGGGTLLLPQLLAFGVAAKEAVGTAAAMGLLIALPGAAAYLTFSHLQDAYPFTLGALHWLAFVVLIPITTVFAPLGAYLAHRANETLLKKALGLLLVVTGAKMAFF